MEEASREVFWNIQFGEVIYILAVITLFVFVYAIYRRYKLWKMGKPEVRLGHFNKRLWTFIVTVFVDGFFHRKFFGSTSTRAKNNISIRRFLPTDFYPGIIHFFIFFGCIILLLGSFLDFISHYFFNFMHGSFYLAYSLVTDIAGIIIVLGVILVIIRRYIQRPDRLDNKREDLTALLIILVVVISGFVVESIRIAATELENNPDWALWSPMSFVLAQALKGLSQNTLSNWHLITWWAHSLISLGAIIYISLYWNRLWHIIVSTLNAFFRNLETKGTLQREDFSIGQRFGVADVQDFTWKELMDLDACTRCGRCQEACPAYASGKPLNPKKVIQDLKGSLTERFPTSSKNKNTQVSNHESRYTSLSDVVTEEVIWECTTCGACIEVCPVYIEPMPKLIGIRRNLVEMESKFPEELLNFFENMEQRSNPWGIAPSDRIKWASETSVQPFNSEKTEYLFFVGCAGAFDPRSRHVTLALTKIMDSANLSWGILGKDESCCGDSLRRLGNEYVFDRMVKENIDMFKEKGIRKIITQCPHCYHTLKNDYRQYGIYLEIFHHSELINNLINEGKLKINQARYQGKIVFHDSCYLGRYNSIYKVPRKTILQATGKKPIEMERSHDRSFCCGAGGGRMWMEESIGKHINVLRIEEAMKENPDSICVCCPYCMTMLEDGLKDKGINTKVQVKDLAEIVAQAIKQEKTK